MDNSNGQKIASSLPVVKFSPCWETHRWLTENWPVFRYRFRSANRHCACATVAWSNSLLIERSRNTPYRTERRLLGPRVVRTFVPPPHALNATSNVICGVQFLAWTTATHCSEAIEHRIPLRLWHGWQCVHNDTQPASIHPQLCTPRDLPHP